MVKDPGNNKPRRSRKSSSRNTSMRGGRGGMAGGLGNLVAVVLPYLIRRPKLLIGLIKSSNLKSVNKIKIFLQFETELDLIS